MKTQRIKRVAHKMYGTRPYSIWTGIKRRCLNKNDPTYRRYGAKGITICKEWKNSFMSFWKDMEDGYRDDLQIDRIDNTKGYSKENCRWATRKEQANNKGNNLIYTYNGKTLCCSDWDKKLGLKPGSVRMRIKKYKWPIEKALSHKKIKYKGYIKDKERNCYQVQIKRNGKNHFIGRFKTIREAKQARQKSIAEILGICKI